MAALLLAVQYSSVSIKLKGYKFIQVDGLMAKVCTIRHFWSRLLV